MYAPGSMWCSGVTVQDFSAYLKHHPTMSHKRSMIYRAHKALLFDLSLCSNRSFDTAWPPLLLSATQTISRLKPQERPVAPSTTRQGGEYAEFAGHDISRRVARGIKDAASSSISIDSGPLDDLSLEGLDRFENMTLRGWEDTFKARGYPRVGRVVTPPPPRSFSRAELRAFDGRSAFEAAINSEGAGGGRACGEEPGLDVEGKGAAGAGGEAVPEPAPAPAPMPAGYATRPIYMAVKDKVFDVSFGGSEFYVDGGPYECLAGRDASRVLARMSMKPEDVEGVLDYASLNDREEKNLDDWVEKLGEGGRGYPVVGWIDIS